MVKNSTDVYATLGFEDAAEMNLKAFLAEEIQTVITTRGLTQHEAAKVLGLPQPRVSRVLNGQFRGLSVMKMIECLKRLGKEVDIVVREPDGSRETQIKLRPAGGGIRRSPSGDAHRSPRAYNPSTMDPIIDQ